MHLATSAAVHGRLTYFIESENHFVLIMKWVDEWTRAGGNKQSVGCRKFWTCNLWVRVNSASLNKSSSLLKPERKSTHIPSQFVGFCTIFNSFVYIYSSSLYFSVCFLHIKHVLNIYVTYIVILSCMCIPLGVWIAGWSHFQSVPQRLYPMKNIQ